MKRCLGECCAALLLVMFGTVTGYSQISPGPLTRAHAMLSGPSHCTECHSVGRGKPEFKCLDCHRDIRERLQEKRGLHPSLVGADLTSNGCVRCHSDHNGRNFEMIHWDTPLSRFDHHRTGYTLEGRHARLACRDCHQAARIAQAARETISVKDFDRTYLGLSTKCLGCHADEHQGQLPTECANCHDSLSWKSASAQFDHNRARFRLAGGHERVACEKCHTRVDAPKPYVRYRGIPFEDCTPCHKDPHKGAFSAGCRSCHSSPANWKPLQVTGVFDHSKTKYPLEGKHLGVPCQSCHRQSADFTAPVAFARCSDCHKQDPHRGQFAGGPAGGDCAECHRVAGFKPSTFDVARHAGTHFPLKGRHAGVPCEKCHVEKTGTVVYAVTETACAACHSDVHGGQFKGPPHRNRCDDCHTEEHFKPSTFTLSEHSTTRFPLAGAHMAVVCVDCHREPTGDGGAQPARFVFDNRACSACHEDPHGGQFSQRMAGLLPDGTAAGCRACHSTKSWRELQGFDHAATEFPLEGSHRAVPCEQCHKADNLTTGARGVLYSSTPKQCSACHEDIHAGQFAVGGQPAECGRCHRVLKWRPSTFDHNTQSAYKLDGAHRTVRCALCHTTTREVAGRAVVFYKPTPRTCSACHGLEPAGNLG